MGTTALAIQQDSVVANLVRASTALAEAKTIQQTKAIVDVAAAAEIYAKRQQLGEEAIGIAHSIKLEALRKLGEMLKETPKNEGTKGQLKGKNSSGGAKTEPPEETAPTLAELGLDKKTSSIAQKLADLPEEAFKQVQDGHESIAKAIAAVKEAKPAPAKPQKIEVVSDELTKLREENTELRDNAMELARDLERYTAIENGQADELIKRLQIENAALKHRIQAITTEKNEAIKDCRYWRKQAEKRA